MRGNLLRQFIAGDFVVYNGNNGGEFGTNRSFNIQLINLEGRLPAERKSTKVQEDTRMHSLCPDLSRFNA